MGFIETQLERIPGIRTAETPGVYIKQRLQNAAHELSLRGDTQTHVEIVNEALCRVTQLLYEADTDGSFANIDNRTYRILVPVAWGSAGWKTWGLRQWEAEILRSILIERSAQQSKRPALFDYSPDSRTWFVNVSDYGSYDLAQRFLQRESVTLAQWRKHVDGYRQRKSSADKTYRQRIANLSPGCR